MTVLYPGRRYQEGIKIVRGLQYFYQKGFVVIGKTSEQYWCSISHSHT
jgi:hypothetical protein